MNRLEWILGIVLVVLLVLVVALSLVFWFRPDNVVDGPAANSATIIAQRADDIEPTPVFDGRTAIVAYAAAQKTAAEWQEDAQLLNASATFPQGANAQQIRSGDTTWAFTFYSPATQQVAAISVVEDQARLVSENEHNQMNPVLSTSGWNLDSDEAIQATLQEGGAQFINDEGVTTLTMTLFADDQEQNGRLEWLVSLIAPQSGRALTVRLDATSGELLENNILP